MRPSSRKPPTGGSRTEGIRQSTQQGSSNTAPLGTGYAVLRQRLRDLAAVQAVADRNFDRDTFGRAHRAWLLARWELETSFPDEVRRIDDMQLVGVEANHLAVLWPTAQDRTVQPTPVNRDLREYFSERVEGPGSDLRGVA